MAWALLVTALDLAAVWRHDDGGSPEPVAGGRAIEAPILTAPPTTVPPSTSTTTAVPPPTTASRGTATGAKTADGSGGGAAIAPPPPSTIPTTPTEPAEPSVHCDSELALEDAPDAPYSFLCMRGDRPVTWRQQQLTLHAVGLSVDQQTALQAAIAQFQEAAGFTVIQVSNAAAQIEVSVGDLSNGEGGHATMHYTCTTTCAYDHAAIVLSQEKSLTEGVWVTTMLHELGHVAGLNHVSRSSQVMYPTLTLQSPLVYAAGDRAGFAELRRTSAA
jgi:hypothetical protein